VKAVVDNRATVRQRAKLLNRFSTRFPRFSRFHCPALLAAAVFVSLPALAQTSAPATGCGSPSIRFEVNNDPGLHPAPPTPGRALVYFLQNDEKVSGFRKPTVRIGVDGAWVGATHGTSYTFFYVDPGQHHLCSDWQDVEFFHHKMQTSRTLDFTVEAGKVYYFLVTNNFRGASRSSTQLEQITTSNQEDLLADFQFAFFHQLP